MYSSVVSGKSGKSGKSEDIKHQPSKKERREEYCSFEYREWSSSCEGNHPTGLHVSRCDRVRHTGQSHHLRSHLRDWSVGLLLVRSKKSIHTFIQKPTAMDLCYVLDSTEVQIKTSAMRLHGTPRQSVLYCCEEILSI